MSAEGPFTMRRVTETGVHQGWLSSLKTRLALAGAGLIAISVVLAALLALRLVDSRVNQVLLDSESSQVLAMSRVVSGRLLTRQLSLRQVAGTLDPKALTDSPRLLAWLDQHRELFTLFNSVFVAAPSGALLAHSDGEAATVPRVNVADRLYFHQTLATKVPQISEPVEDRVTGGATLVFTMPLLDRHGHLFGVLGGGLKLRGRELVSDLVDADPGVNNGRIVAIFDQHGRIVAHPDPAMLMQMAVRDPRLAQVVQAWRESGSAAEPSGWARRAGGYFQGIAGVPLAEFSVVSSTPEATLLGSVDQARQRALWLALALAAFGGVALWGTTLWLLRPFDRVKRRAAAMALLDEPEASPWTIETGEVGELARVLQDVERRSREGARERAQLLRQMHSVLAHASMGILFTVDRNMVLVGHALCQMLGYAEADLAGQSVRRLFPSDAVFDGLVSSVDAAFAQRELFDAEVQFLKRDGSVIWVRLMGRPIQPDNPSAGTIWIIDDVGEARRRREELAWASTHDSLTGLLNRPAFEQALEKQLTDRRDGQAARPFCVLALDLDHFKQINDTGGHAAGDVLLREAATLMANRLRRADMLARLGGDEFAAVLTDCGLSVAMTVAESICEQLSEYRLPWQGSEYSVGVSIGVVEVDAQLGTMAQVLALADAACYQAKRSGRNRVVAAARPSAPSA